MSYQMREEPISQMMASMESLDITSMRPDIKTARDASVSIKSKLGYRDEEELDTGVQKVQPLPFLDEEIQRYHASIRESVRSAQEVNESVPQDVLQLVDRATALAQEGMTSLFKASQLLEFTFDAYQYARGAARDQFDLSRRSEQHIKQFEEMFKSMIHFRVNTDLSKAATELEECQKSLEHAMEESRRDVQSLEKRAGDEDAVIQEESLQESHDQVLEMVKLERSELNLIGEQCLKDIHSIDEEMLILKRHMTHAEQQYQQNDSQRQRKLNNNKKEQRELTERLRVLKEEEQRLVRDGKTGTELQDQAASALALTEKDIHEWRSRIEELKRKTDTSLRVMNCMEECTNIIMADAKRKKTSWKTKLQQLAVDSNWMLRECLLLKGATFMMILEENKSNAAESKKLIANYEKEKIQAARSGFAPRLNDAMSKIEQYKTAEAEYNVKVAESEEKIKVIREDLVTLDEKLHTLRPGLKLDTIENRYEELKEVKSKAFDAMSTDGIVFSFYHSLPPPR